jgi:hypothetical protein
MKIERSKFLSLCFSLVPAAAIACGGSGDDGTAGGGQAVSAGAQPPAASTGNPPAAPAAPGAPAAAVADVVTVNSTAINVKNDQCTIDIKAPAVSIPTNPATEKAINDVLAPLGNHPCAEGGEDFFAAFEVTANGSGLLSIRVTGDSDVKEAAHPNGFAETFNFDVKNGGKLLKLSDVITPAGLQKELKVCAITVDAISAGDDPPAQPDLGSPIDEGSFGLQECQTSLTPDPQFNFDPGFVATAKGLEVEAEVAHALGDVIGTTVAWKDIVPDGLGNTVVLDFAKAQK